MIIVEDMFCCKQVSGAGRCEGFKQASVLVVASRRFVVGSYMAMFSVIRANKIDV